MYFKEDRNWVLRIEGEDGVGMFMYKDGLKNKRKIVPSSVIPSLSDKAQRLNSPTEDGINITKFSGEWFCGFESIKQMLMWVSPHDLEKLFSIGFKLMLYNPKEYEVGSQQVVFTKSTCTESINISKLFLRAFV